MGGWELVWDWVVAAGRELQYEVLVVLLVNVALYCLCAFGRSLRESQRRG